MLDSAGRAGSPSGSFAALVRQYDAPMFRHVHGRASRGVIVLARCATIAGSVALGRYAMHPVGPDCIVATSRTTDGNGQFLTDGNGKTRTDEELLERACREAVDSGRCEPPRTRWRQWFD